MTAFAATAQSATICKRLQRNGVPSLPCAVPPLRQRRGSMGSCSRLLLACCSLVSDRLVGCSCCIASVSLAPLFPSDHKGSAWSRRQPAASARLNRACISVVIYKRIRFSVAVQKPVRPLSLRQCLHGACAFLHCGHARARRAADAMAVNTVENVCDYLNIQAGAAACRRTLHPSPHAKRGGEGGERSEPGGGSCAPPTLTDQQKSAPHP
jgi:hypothetical protein